MNATISWACRKQMCVALSSTEAEYISIAEACQEGIWLQRSITEFTRGREIKTTIFKDNQSCLKLIENKRSSHRTKHIDTKYHFINDLKDRKVMNFMYCPTEEMIADMLTKPLNKIKLKYFSEKSGLKAHN